MHADGKSDSFRQVLSTQGDKSGNRHSGVGRGKRLPERKIAELRRCAGHRTGTTGIYQSVTGNSREVAPHMRCDRSDLTGGAV